MGWRDRTDAIGPEKVVFVRDPTCGLDAVVVVDNVAAGPAIGGVRMAPGLDSEEVVRLARTMTLKNAVAGLPHGGAKAGIVADPAVHEHRKRTLVRAFARAIRHLVDYIPGPDMGLDETCMAWLHSEIGRAVGLPAVLGGIPLDELGATGYGLAVAAEVVEEATDLRLAGARVSIEGFGAVGSHAARFLVERGAVVVAVADSRGSAYVPEGFDVEKLRALKARGQPVRDYPGARCVADENVSGVDCDIFVPAARPDTVTLDNVDRVRARVVLEGANIAVTQAADAALHDRGIVVVPDFVANAGGVICAAVEHRGGTAAQAFAVIEEQIRMNTREVLERARQAGVTPRDAATEIAVARVHEAMTYRRS